MGHLLACSMHIFSTFCSRLFSDGKHPGSSDEWLPGPLPREPPWAGLSCQPPPGPLPAAPPIPQHAGSAPDTGGEACTTATAATGSPSPLVVVPERASPSSAIPPPSEKLGDATGFPPNASAEQRVHAPPLPPVSSQWCYEQPWITKSGECWYLLSNQLKLIMGFEVLRLGDDRTQCKQRSRAKWMCKRDHNMYWNHNRR